MSDVFEHRLDNGLVLVAEPIAAAASVSMALMTPGGLAAQPDDQLGVAPVLAEMVTRGAGGKGAREHSEALDELGVQRGTSTGGQFLSVSASMLGEKLGEALPLLVDMLRRPNLKEASLGPSVELALQSLEALKDDPQGRAMVRLRGAHYPEPLNRSSYGRAADLEGLTLDCVRAYAAKRCVAGGSVLGVAGAFDWEQLKAMVDEVLGDWKGSAEPVAGGDVPERAYHHEKADTSQVHIGLAYDAPPATAEDAVLQRFAASVLSGGMAGRLFTEVREKRGLCYSVGVRYAEQRELGAVLGYAGTTVARAQETLDVFVGELARLSEGVTEAEFERAKVGLKSGLVMQGESTGARASAIAGDVYTFGAPRTLEARATEVDGVTLDAVNEYVASHRLGALTVMTVGPEELRVPDLAGVGVG
ncbi:MAG: pitrilysin family protein [Planctomycetota bacterium]